MYRPEDLLDAHPIVENAVEYGFTDLVVVQGAGSTPGGVARKVVQQSHRARYSP